MKDAAAHPSAGSYWKAWVALLAITVVMVFVGSRPVLLLGMAAKASLIVFLFMHLRYEEPALVLSVLIGIFLTAAILFLLLVPDGMAM